MAKYKSFLKALANPFTSKSSKGKCHSFNSCLYICIESPEFSDVICVWAKDPNEADLEKIAAQEQKQFPFEVLVAATNNFHPTLKLGEGGFGPVYKVKTKWSAGWIGLD